MIGIINCFGAILLTITSVILGCKPRPKNCFNLIDYCSYNEYSSENTSFEDEIVDSSADSISFYFSNNPFCLDSSYKIKLYFNHILSYKGNYQPSGKLFLPSNLKDGDPVHFRLLIKPTKDNLVFSLENKNVIVWRSFFKHLYIATFIGGKEQELIEFYPLAEPIAR